MGIDKKKGRALDVFNMQKTPSKFVLMNSIFVLQLHNLHPLTVFVMYIYFLFKEKIFDAV